MTVATRRLKRHRGGRYRDEMDPPLAAAVTSPTRPARRRWRRVVARSVSLCFAIYAFLLIAMMFLETSLLFFPSRQARGGWDVPGVERVRFEADDGTQLHGWFLEHPQPREVLMFACGNAGNISHRAERFAHLRDAHRVSLLAFDYRGYGLSAGKPHERGLLLDARAARRWLAERTGVKESDIVLMGESLGGGVMVDLAARDGARGLILERTFTSLPDVGAYHYSFIPVRLLMRNRLDSLSKIGDYRRPLLMCHGDADEIIPLSMGQRLFEAANEPKRFVLLPGLGHNDPLPGEWDEALDGFLASLP